MELFPYILLGIFVVLTIVGYLLINNVPSLLHTPLMSGMNALSGIIITGALVTTSVVLKDQNQFLASVIGGLSVASATLNVFGGFIVTDRMLKMFRKRAH
ncbi:MAG: NAD(P) transhydrogenase subunit alpha [Acholeplasmataceae bacterium]|nr:NAD(P) transhydrogenase subunit alpha [Acholeplasmataceae bacterium]MDD4194055.1 NAD(P) transhydrogenase subunit alpha [Acholeplasmataceae bacterium]